MDQFSQQLTEYHDKLFDDGAGDNVNSLVGGMSDLPFVNVSSGDIVNSDGDTLTTISP